MAKQKKIDLKAIAWDAMERYGFKPRFPDKVMREGGDLHTDSSTWIHMDAKDLRTLLWSSIDNIDSMDLDQLEYCERGPEREIIVKIAISEVDFFVPKNSSIDRHAAYNGTSVYTGAVIFPLLPDRLSKGITSLLPGQDSLAIVVEYTVLPDGQTKPIDIYRAVVSNKAKLIYEEIGDWLEGKTDVPEPVKEYPGLKEQILLQNEVMQTLKKHRREMGALDLDTREAHAILEGDTVIDLGVQRQNTARCIIEEFMVAANGTMVNFLEKAGVPMIERIVRVPKYWSEIRSLGTNFGFSLPQNPDANALAKFLKLRREADPERFPDLSLTVVKLIGSGEYAPFIPGKEPIGHFALAVTEYTHGTAPNRRYVDLIIQRLLKSVLLKTSTPYNLTELIELSAWLTDREKASKKVERFMLKASAAMVLHTRIGEIFDALVTGASPKGTYARLFNPPAEGRVMSGEKGLKIGEKVRVRLLKTDPYNGHIDFERLK